MSLCSDCERISVVNLTRVLQLPSWMTEVTSTPAPRGMVHLSDARKLPASAAAGCAVCGLLLECLLHSISEHDALFPGFAELADPSSGQIRLKLEESLVNKPIYLRPNYDPRTPSFPEEGAKGAWHIRGVKVAVPVDRGVLTGSVRLHAHRDSAAGASCDIITRPPLSASDSPEAYELLERCLSVCLTSHEACRETLFGSPIDESLPPVLPTRVIHIRRIHKGLSLRLLETQGRSGHYVALSHCWGPSSHRPLMTTLSSHLGYLGDIPWDHLPRNYQDAITATDRLGFEYIWIDSLCIIQDLHSDWLQESRCMADVYQNARLTIASSHASDSSQPCFFPRSPAPPPVELPQDGGSIFASLLPTDYTPISPERGPLAYRAWATQEWLLSRRMIFYTNGNLVWSCMVVSRFEEGLAFHITARNPRWKIIIEKYSQRALTNATDRLVALEGVRSAIHAKRPDDTYCFGLWKHSMPDQLLWFLMQPAERHRSELGLPTWTWASTMHGVRFLNINGARNTCDAFRFDESTRELGIRGVLSPAPEIATLVGSKGNPGTVLGGGESQIRESVGSGLVYCLREGDGQVGFCVLDERDFGESDGKVVCLQLMHRKMKEHVDGRVERWYKDWVLLLRLTTLDTGDEIYERVGAGIIECKRPWFEGRAVQDVRIR